MVMRGVPATREKGMYIFTDAAREARAAGTPYGNFYDPIGDPARRCYALYPWAASQGKGVELCSSFLRHAFVLGPIGSHVISCNLIDVTSGCASPIFGKAASLIAL